MVYHLQTAPNRIKFQYYNGYSGKEECKSSKSFYMGMFVMDFWSIWCHFWLLVFCLSWFSLLHNTLLHLRVSFTNWIFLCSTFVIYFQFTEFTSSENVIFKSSKFYWSFPIRFCSPVHLWNRLFSKVTSGFCESFLPKTQFSYSRNFQVKANHSLNPD